MVGIQVPEYSEKWSRCLSCLSRGLTQTRNVLFSCCAVILLTLLIAPCHLAQAQEGWRDDFEPYDLGTFPSAPWSPSGNGDVGGRVEEESGNRILKLRGTGACWAALAHRTMEVPNTAFTVEFDVYSTVQGAPGCHAHEAAIAFHTQPDWRSPTGGPSVTFLESGIIGETDPPLPWSPGQWYHVRMDYRVEGGEKITDLFINDQFAGQVRGSFDPATDGAIAYLSFASGEAEAWFDNVTITPSPIPPVLPTVSLSCRPEYLASGNFFLHITATIPDPATAQIIIRLEVTSATGPNVSPEIGHPVSIYMFPGENTGTERTGGLCGEFDPDIGWTGNCSITYTVKSAYIDGGPDIPSAIGQSVTCAFGN